MLNWEYILQKYIIGCSSPINKITKPLKKHLGINFFGYHRIDNKGKYVVLTDHPAWAEYYLENKLFQSDPFLRHPREYSNGISFFGDVNLEKKAFPDTLNVAWRKITKSTDGIVLIEKNKDVVEFFIFAGNHPANNGFNKLFLNHLPLLRAFSDHFKKEARSILVKQTEENFSLPFSWETAGNCSPTFDPKIEVSKQKQFLASIGHEEILNKVHTLTPREMDCLKQLHNGTTSVKGVAAELSLSPRTVEYYLENIKNKLDCWNKEDLAVKTNTLHSLGLL